MLFSVNVSRFFYDATRRIELFEEVAGVVFDPIDGNAIIVHMERGWEHTYRFARLIKV